MGVQACLLRVPFSRWFKGKPNENQPFWRRPTFRRQTSGFGFPSNHARKKPHANTLNATSVGVMDTYLPEGNCQALNLLPASPLLFRDPSFKNLTRFVRNCSPQKDPYVVRSPPLMHVLTRKPPLHGSSVLWWMQVSSITSSLAGARMIEDKSMNISTQASASYGDPKNLFAGKCEFTRKSGTPARRMTGTHAKACRPPFEGL